MSFKDSLFCAPLPAADHSYRCAEGHGPAIDANRGLLGRPPRGAVKCLRLSGPMSTLAKELYPPNGSRSTVTFDTKD